MYHPFPHLVLRSTILGIACIGCGFPELPQISESTGQSYAEYRAEYPRVLLDPIGATDISMCTAFEGDGYDEWWRFTVTQEDFRAIATAVAHQQNGPAGVLYSTDGAIPDHWEPDAEIPSWWVPPTKSSLNCVHWCFATGAAERHHGWFLLHDATTSHAYVWHWNHQWSSDECR